MSGGTVRPRRSFAPIFPEIEQFGLARQQGELHQLPVAFADGAAERLHIDQNVLVRGGLAVRHRRPNILAVEGVVGAALAAGEAQQRRHDVHHGQRRIDHMRRQFAWPVEDRRDPHTAFMERAFAVTQFPVRTRRLGAQGQAAAGRRSSGERAPVANSALVTPPLSLAKMISVLSRMFFWRSAATMRPTWVSSSVIIAA